MKIGIITFWNSQDNYGQIMQSFALYSYLVSIGHDVVIIRYLPNQSTSTLDKITKISPWHLWAYYKYRKNQKSFHTLNDVKREFDNFRRMHMIYTDKVYHGFAQLWEEDWTYYDAFVCGSDQIWSPKPDEQLNAYFLQFAPFKSLRIAYAPSFGRSELPKEYQTQLHRLLQHFDAVSVREEEGVGFCKDSNIDCQMVCDPTLLLQDATYRQLTGVSERDNMAFCYLIGWDTLFPIEEIRKIVSTKYDGVHYFCTNGQKQFFSYERDQTIENWLGSIQKSQIVFTNSFHGTVFSILSHTPFVAFPLTGKSAVMNNRLFSILGRLGLDNRIYDEDKNLHRLIETPIDWNNVDNKLHQFRVISENFLCQALQGKERRCEHNICFLTSGAVHHNYGGLDRVTELLADYFYRMGAKVYFVSQRKREIYHGDNQYFLPNSEKFHTEDNAKWLNDFIKSNNIDILINQEGNFLHFLYYG